MADTRNMAAARRFISTLPQKASQLLAEGLPKRTASAYSFDGAGHRF
jgi:hypothetical protein